MVPRWIARSRFASSGLFHSLLRSILIILPQRSPAGDPNVIELRAHWRRDLHPRRQPGLRVRPAVTHTPWCLPGGDVHVMTGLTRHPGEVGNVIQYPPAAVSCIREALRSEGWDPAGGWCPGLDWPKTAGPGLAVKWIARSRFASSGLFHALLRSSWAWLAAHEKALPRSRQGDHQVPRTGLEPAQPFGHHPLKVACLPISPPGQGAANIAACHIRETLLLHQPGNIAPRA